MPRLASAIPKYRLHRASGQAVVNLAGSDYYLGPHGTKASRLEYDRLIAEWLANGRQRSAATDSHPTSSVTLVEVCAAYKRYAEGYYRKNGVVTNEVTQIVAALTVAQALYGSEPADSFGPLKLQAVQQAMLARDWSRKHINKQIARIVRAFSWATSKEMIAANVVQALREVAGLRKGRCDARETEPIRPVDDAIVEKTLAFLPAVVGDMVRIQRLTGSRPEDVCRMRPGDLDRGGEVWTYRPEIHKTEHQGKTRVIFLGPRAQAILQPYLARPAASYCFSPKESEAQRQSQRHQRRVIPRTHGNAPGTNRVSQPKRSPQECYTTASYRRAIHRACEAAFNKPVELKAKCCELASDQQTELRRRANAWRQQHLWSPNQLRHTAATEVRKRFGVEGAQIVLGHAAADVTQV
ncbi:Phage integrase family protein [Anatilimnocola aggregata]|uniref:Phage integrase family protein n=1 Tax=Anatilimnocola aggregata TaxID=2528021 RepID=A0A517YDZ1_9BACT|nr:site-specific integrase [Anatilimnocola aggregata]QDU28460.1 Phage integrase family protein [Anatilimnocola aggregata]